MHRRLHRESGRGNWPHQQLREIGRFSSQVTGQPGPRSSRSHTGLEVPLRASRRRPLDPPGSWSGQQTATPEPRQTGEHSSRGADLLSRRRCWNQSPVPGRQRSAVTCGKPGADECTEKPSGPRRGGPTLWWVLPPGKPARAHGLGWRRSLEKDPSWRRRGDGGSSLGEIHPAPSPHRKPATPGKGGHPGLGHPWKGRLPPT